MIRESYTDIIGREKQILADSEELTIEGNKLLAHTNRDGYHGVTEGYHVFEVDKQGTEYYVHFEGAQDSIVVYTDRDDINILVKSRNAYEQPEWKTYKQSTVNTELEVIKAFNEYAKHAYSHGGSAPYIELLIETLAEMTEPEPEPEPEPEEVPEA